MPLSYPLPRSAFADLLSVRDRAFSLSESMEVSETAGGQILTADYGPRLWRGRVELNPLRYAQADSILSIIRALQQGQRKFDIYDYGHTAPAEDPDGSTLGAATPSVLAIPSNNSIRLQGLPVQYQISRGDVFTVVASTGRIVRFQAAEPIAAGGAGQTLEFEVIPQVPASVEAGDSVELLKSYCRAIIRPGSVNEGRRQGLHIVGISFGWIEAF